MKCCAVSLVAFNWPFLKVYHLGLVTVHGRGHSSLCSSLHGHIDIYVDKHTEQHMISNSVKIFLLILHLISAAACRSLKAKQASAHICQSSSPVSPLFTVSPPPPPPPPPPCFKQPYPLDDLLMLPLLCTSSNQCDQSISAFHLQIYN